MNQPASNDATPGRPSRPTAPRRPARDAQPETLIELLTRDLEAWRLAKGVITKARLTPG